MLFSFQPPSVHFHGLGFVISGDDKAVFEHRSFARIRFLGTIYFTISNFWASAKLIIKPHPLYDLVQFESLDYIVYRLQSGGVRLLMTGLAVIYSKLIHGQDKHTLLRG